MTSVTRHGERRVRGRLGLPKRAVEAAAERAWAEGNPRRRFTGSIRRYLDRVAAREPNRALRVHGTALYIFDPAGNLVTAWPLPAKYAKAAARSLPSPVAAAASGAGVDPDAPPHDPGPKSGAAGESEGSLPPDPTTAPTPSAARGRLPERDDHT